MATTNMHESFEPAFDFSTNERCICIDSGEGELIFNGREEVCNVEVYVQFIPVPRIIFRGQSTPLFDEFRYRKRAIDGFTCNSSINIPPPKGKLPCSWDFVPSLEPVVIVGDDTTQMHEVIFHLFNHTNLPLNICLQSGEIEVTIKPLPDTDDRINRIKETGEILFTHVGRIKPLVKREFSGKEARNYIEAIRFFLSFASGRWCNLVCPVGLNENKDHVWKLGISPQIMSDGVLTWTDRNRSDQLISLFLIFMEKWNDTTWQKILRDVLYLYLHANNGVNGIDIGLVVTQAAIELLAYDFCVNKRKLLASDGFKKMKASDKFRLLFSTLNIPLVIPAKCSELSKLVRVRKWSDAPHALTEIRNAFVHPDSKNSNIVTDSYNEAWRLGLWYLELSILAILDYSGSYANRLICSRWQGQVASVPWQNNQP